MKTVIAKYITTELLNRGDGADAHVGDDDNLLGSGLVDSLGIMSLIAFLEQEFSVQVPPEDVTIENFESLTTISAYVAQRQAEQT